jgi:hypothetical protein
VILGHYSDNALRNVNQHRGFLANQPVGLKPRFMLEESGLRLVALPELTEDEHRALPWRGRELLPFDYFAPGAGAGVESLQAPFTLAVLRAAGHYRLRARLAGRPSYAEFYDPGHPSQALQVTEAIVTAFAAEAERRGQRALVLLIPDEKDLRLMRAGRPLPYAELERRLRARGIRVPDVAGAMVRALGERDACALYTRCAAGHFTVEGYRLLALVTRDALTGAGWLGADGAARPRP